MRLYFFDKVSRSLYLGAISVFCGVVLLASCGGDKEKDASLPGASPKKDAVVATPEQRAEKLGLMSMVPAEASSVLAVYDLPYLVGSVKGSGLGQFLDNKGIPLAPSDDVEIVEVEGTVTIGVEDSETVVKTEIDIPVKDVVIATGGNTVGIDIPVKDVVIATGGNTVEILNALAEDYAKWTAYNCGHIMPLNLLGELPDAEVMQKEVMEMVASFKILDFVDFSPGKGMAPLLMLAEVSEETAGQVKSSVNQMLPVAAMFSQGAVTMHSGKHGGIDFSGIAVDGKALSSLLKKNLANAPLKLDQKKLDEVFEKISTGKLYVLLGSKGNTMIAAICTNPEEQLNLPATPADSILAKLDFADRYLDKKAALAGYATADLYKALMNYSIKQQEALNEGIAALAKAVSGKKPEVKPYADAFVENSKIAISEITSQYKAYDTSVPVTAYGWYDAGLMLESVSGDYSAFDWTNPVEMSGVCDMPDVVFAGAASLSDFYVSSSIKLMESLAGAAWNGFQVYVNLKGDEKTAGIYEMAKKVVPMVQKIWAVSKDGSTAFGNQYAGVLDMKGSLPRMECLDENITAKGCLPRFASMQNLKDRAKVESTLTAVFDVYNQWANEMGMDLKIKESAKEEKDGYTSHLYQYTGKFAEQEPAKSIFKLYMHNEPATTLNDKVCIGGTAKALNYEMAKAAKPASKVNPEVYGSLGACIKFDVQTLNKAINQWGELNLGDEKVFIALDAFTSDIKEVRVTVSKEDGKVYSRFHVKTK